jgi:exodeoxyribonuclease VII small subunit
MEASKTYTYTSAFEELQEIVREIERGEILIDELAIKIKKAKQLIDICNSKLTESESEVNKLLANFAEKENDQSP